jgi:hypothetical protein
MRLSRWDKNVEIATYKILAEYSGINSGVWHSIDGRGIPHAAVRVLFWQKQVRHRSVHYLIDVSA